MTSMTTAVMVIGRSKKSPWQVLASIGLIAVLAGCQSALPLSEPNAQPTNNAPSSTATAGLSEPKESAMPGRETPEQEAIRLKAQREQAEQSSLMVFSAGATRRSGIADGALLTLTVAPIGLGWARGLSVDLQCAQNCIERQLRVGSHRVKIRSRLVVVPLKPGAWRVSHVTLNEGGRSKGETSIKLANAIEFQVKRGHATYLGAFVVVGGAQEVRTRTGKKLISLPILRYSDLEQDMARALSKFPQTRGRRMLNAVKGMSKPVTIR